MITLTKDGSAIKFTFDDSQHYLTGDGVIEVPVNSLALVTDESDMVTFKKAASNDIFISALYSDFGMSKSELIAWYKNNMVSSGGGGSVSGDVYTKSETDEKIAEATSGKADTSAVTASIAAAVSGLAPYSAVTEDIDEALEDYYDKDEIDAAFSSVTESEQVTATALNDLNDRADTIEQVTAIALNDLNDNKANIDDVYAKVSGLTIELDGETPRIYLEKESDGTIYEALMNDSGFDSYLETEDGSTYDTNFAFGLIGQEAHDHPESGISSDRMFNISTDGFYQETDENDDEGGYTRYSSINEFNYATGLQLSQTWYEPDPDNEGEYIETTSSIELINNSEGATQIHLTDVDGNELFIEADGFEDGTGKVAWADVATENYVDDEIDAAVSGKADTSAVTSSITAAVSGKQDTLVSGTNIKTINNQSLLGSGNITISGGSGGSNIVEVTQAQYEELVSGGTVDPDALYIITDASEINVSGFVQTSAITTAVTSASTDSQIPTAKAVYDAIPTGGTGASYSAGTNISIDTGNTISCTLPITANTNNNQGWLLFGSGLNVWGSDSNGRYQVVIGKNINNPSTTNGQVAICPSDTTANINSELTGDYPVGIGHRIIAKGNGAVAIGDHSNANGANTLAIGKDTTATGTTKTNINNQITVDTSNQVYISNSANTSTYCVQQKLETTEAALGGLKFVQCTQAQYDALVSGGTVDSSTVYFITGSNS